MNFKISQLLSTVSFCFVILAASSPTVLGVVHDTAPCVANETTVQQLKAARQATARFQNTQAAEKADYINIDLFIPNMGEHLLNPNLVDAVFEPDKPEALVYADLGNGRLQLVAVEYLAPYTPSGPPEGFAGDCDQWSEFPVPDDPDTPESEAIFWTLHAWIWEPNISGTFAKFNPLIP
jgi:hypothetical protein